GLENARRRRNCPLRVVKRDLGGLLGQRSHQADTVLRMAHLHTDMEGFDVHVALEVCEIVIESATFGIFVSVRRRSSDGTDGSRFAFNPRALIIAYESPSSVCLARMLGRCGRGESKPAFTNQHQIANVNQRVWEISENPNGIASENEVNAHENASGNAP